jgi:hypothetical protein
MDISNIALYRRIKAIDRRTLVFLISLVLLSSLNLILFGSLNQKNSIQSSYDTLINRTETIENYYRKLQDQYSTLRDDYDQLKVDNDNLALNYSNTQRQLDDLVNHRLQAVIEEGKSLKIGPEENQTLVYNLPASGYAEIQLNSTGEIFMWVGSSMVEGVYYSRLPPYPKTSTEMSVQVPVSPSLYIFLVNTEKSEVKIDLRINLVY